MPAIRPADMTNLAPILRVAITAHPTYSTRENVFLTHESRYYTYTLSD